MHEYKTEVFPLPFRLFSSTLAEEDLLNLDALFNAKSYEGWELHTYTHIGGPDQIGQTLLITFRREVS